MTTQATMQTLFHKTQQAYVACWRVLAGMRRMATSSTFIQDFLEFQPILAEALYDLDQQYRILEQGRNDLVRQKQSLSSDWFLSEIKRLGHYQDAIIEATRMGKELGDAFAWFFYQNDLTHLYKHLEHEPVTEVPTGIGHIGEFAFVNNIKVVDGHLVLYHGITTILRHGDVSLIDLDTLKVISLGELKSQKTGTGEITVTAHFINPQDCALPPSLCNAAKTGKAYEPFSPKMAERFQRQLQGMAASFTPLQTKENQEIAGQTYYPSLMKIAEKLTCSDTAFEQCGDGLLLAGFRTEKNTTLFEKLVESKSDAETKAEEIKSYIPPLIDKNQSVGSQDVNRLVISRFWMGILPGTTPLFWCPVEVSFLEKVFFQDVIVVTVYNPAHLVRKLREIGFEIQPVGNDQFEIHKVVGELRMSLEGFGYFQRLVQNHLVTEEAVVRIMSLANGIVTDGKVGAYTRIPLYISQQFQAHANNETRGLR